ncbi:MAG: DUF2911 domain-containing protein [Balneolaceae bacterium]
MRYLNSLFVTMFALALLLTPVDDAVAQERDNSSARVSPNAAVSQTIGTTVVDVWYGRPSVNERTIFGGLVPFGERWRAGANETTTITFSDDVLIQGESVEAGSYSLHTIPGEESWTIIINENHTWGTQYDMAGDVIRVEAEPEEGIYFEQMMIYFENVSDERADLVLHWDETRVPFEIAIP